MALDNPFLIIAPGVGWSLKTAGGMVCIQCGLAPIPSLGSSQGETGTGKKTVPSRGRKGMDSSHPVAWLGSSVTQPTPSLSRPPLFSKGHSRWRV